jgi:hypothetical protein
MIILIILVILIITGELILRYTEHEATGGITVCVFGFILAVTLIMLPIIHYQKTGQIKRCLIVRQTIETAREDSSEIEKAALQHKIIETNAWIAEHRYWNNTIFDIFIPDEIEDLEYLR